jgi:hypothetical protein
MAFRARLRKRVRADFERGGSMGMGSVLGGSMVIIGYYKDGIALTTSQTFRLMRLKFRQYK